MKRLGTGLVGLGILAVLAGLALRFLIVPGLTQYPDDVDETRTFEGVLGRMLNADALAAGDLGNVFVNQLPITIERSVNVVEVDGQQAVVEDDSVLAGPDGAILETANVYTIDRKSMEHIENFADDDRVIDRDGLVVGFPIGTEAKDYEGWNGDTESLNTIAYQGTETHESGLETMTFKATSGPDLITSPEALARFPESLPKATVETLAPVFGLGDQVELLAALPDPVPLAYTYEYESNYWIDPDTGVLIDFEKSEARQVLLDLGDQQIPVTEVMRLDYQHEEASIADAVADADDARNQIRLFGSTIPIALIIGGLIAAAAGAFAVRRES